MIPLPIMESVAGLVITVASARSAVLNDASTPVFYRLLNSAVAVFGFWLAVTSIPAMLPVLANTHVSVIAHTPGILSVNVTAFKVQGCLWIDTEAYVVKSSDGSNLRANIIPMPWQAPGGSRPVGLNDFGDWIISYSPSVRVSGLRLKSRHECGHRWPIVTDQGPFSLDQLDEALFVPNALPATLATLEPKTETGN